VNILFLGDLVGRPGRRILSRVLPELIEEADAHLVVVNVENAAGGFGMSKQIYDQLAGMGVDALTSGNHVWDRKEFVREVEDCERLIRPENFAPGVPGRGWVVIETGAGPAAVINLAGRVYMPPVDCPFRAADRVLEELDPDVRVIVVDMHAEATSEKEAMGYYLDGRVTAVIGTHTHVPTADAKILPKGTAYISDAGMTGPRDAVIGVKIDPVLQRFLTGMPHRFEAAAGAVELNGVTVACDSKTGRAQNIKLIHRELEPE
jgi:metallophosphoesterase (TIGR00282 family)